MMVIFYAVREAPWCPFFELENHAPVETRRRTLNSYKSVWVSILLLGIPGISSRTCSAIKTMDVGLAVIRVSQFGRHVRVLVTAWRSSKQLSLCAPGGETAYYKIRAWWRAQCIINTISSDATALVPWTWTGNTLFRLNTLWSHHDSKLMEFIFSTIIL